MEQSQENNPDVQGSNRTFMELKSGQQERYGEQ